MNGLWRLRKLLGRRQADLEMDEELRFHLEMEAEKNRRQGMPQKEAERRAAASFGAVASHRDALREGRGIGWAERRLLDVGYALRTFRRRPLIVLFASAIIGLGIGAATIVFSAGHGVLLRPLPYPEAERLLQVHETERDEATGAIEARGYFAWQNFADIREEVRAFESVAAWQYYDRTLTGTGTAVRLAGRMVTPEFFRTLRVQPMLGRSFLAEDAVPGRESVAILSHGAWRTQFGGDSTVVGREVVLDGIPHVVIGVTPAGFDFPSAADLWMPLVPFLGDNGEGARRFHRYRVIGRLGAGVDASTAQAELTALAERLQSEYPETNTGNGFSAEPLRNMLVGDARPALLAVAGAVALLLLITWVNVANLLVARTAARRLELAIRTAMGAGRGRLVSQLLTESLLVAACGGLVGLVVAYFGLDLFKLLAGEALPRADQVWLDGYTLGFAALLTLLTGVVVGIAPALGSVRPAGHDLRSTPSAGGSHTTARARRGLIAGQIALTCILLIVTGLLMRSFQQLRGADAGVAMSGLVVMDVSLPGTGFEAPGEVENAWAQAIRGLQAVPGVSDVAAGLVAPLSGESWGNRLRVEGRPVPETERPLVSYIVATPAYFRTAGIPLLRGSDFDADPGAAAEVIINRTMADRLWPGMDPVGRRVRFSDDGAWSPIVAVAGDAAMSLGGEVQPTAYVSLAMEPVRSMTVMVRTSDDPAATIGGAGRALRAVHPDIVITSASTLTERVFASIAGPRFTMLLATFFALSALLLASLGIYGVLSFLIQQRRRELGVRIAVGARGLDILRLVLREAMKMTSFGIVIGLIASLAITRPLAGLLYATTPTDPLVFAGGTMVLLLVVVIASLAPARVAISTDAAKAIRAD